MVRFWWLESAVLRLICSDSGVNQAVGGCIAFLQEVRAYGSRGWLVKR